MKSLETCDWRRHHLKLYGKPHPVYHAFPGNFLITSLPPVAVHSLSHVQLFAIPWTGVRQASLFFTTSLSSLKRLSIEAVMVFKLEF